MHKPTAADNLGVFGLKIKYRIAKITIHYLVVYIQYLSSIAFVFSDIVKTRTGVKSFSMILSFCFKSKFPIVVALVMKLKYEVLTFVFVAFRQMTMIYAAWTFLRFISLKIIRALSYNKLK